MATADATFAVVQASSNQSPDSNASAAPAVCAIRPQISRWDLKERERRAFEERGAIENWRLADKSRRMLADVSHQLNEALPEVSAEGPEELRPFANQYATVDACGIAVRTGGAVLAEISCGYVLEAAAGVRRIIEAHLHLRAILADPGGSYALKFIEGKGSKLAKLTAQHGRKEEIEALHRLSHADSRALRVLWEPKRTSTAGAVTIGHFHIFPAVDPDMARSLLYVLAKEMVGVAETASEIFGRTVDVTPWVRTELDRLSELAQAATNPREVARSAGGAVQQGTA
jgi:hypothetical protein